MSTGPMKLTHWLTPRLEYCTSVGTYYLAMGLWGLLSDLVAPSAHLADRNILFNEGIAP